MSNLEILKEVRSVYDPKTAFGNKYILKLLGKIVLPNSNGRFDVVGIPEEIHIIRIGWKCVDCGRHHEEEKDNGDELEPGEKIFQTCDCGAKHSIEIEEV